MSTRRNRLQVLVNDEVFDFFTDEAAKTGQTISTVVYQVLTDYVNNNKEK